MSFILLLIMMFSKESNAIKNLESCATNKRIPEVIKENVLIALSYYPELAETSINFRFKQRINGSVMQAQPKYTFLWKKNKNREYIINISSMFKLTHSAIPIHQLPDEIMIGWIGHELGHIMDYESKSTIGLINYGLGYYFSENYLKGAEQSADFIALDHGLGNYILKTKQFILNHSELPEKYKKKIGRLYLSPDEIVRKVKELEELKSSNQLP